MKRIALPFLLLLSACATTANIPIEKPVVVQTQDTKNIAVPTVQPLGQFKPQKFKFQDPKNPTTIIGMDATNYAALRGFILDTNQRDMRWESRLTEANKSIILLQKKSK